MSSTNGEKILELQDIAAQFRQAAEATQIPRFAKMMSRAANELDEAIQNLKSQTASPSLTSRGSET